MVFPALGIITACTIASWLKGSQKEKALPWMIGIVMTVVLVVNVTPIQVKVSLNQNSPNVKDIAPYVRINTKPGERIFNYGFSQWNPTQALAFYSDRFLESPVKDLEVLIQKLKENFYDSAVIAVAHEEIKNLGIKRIRKILRKNSLVFDVMGTFKVDKTDLRL